MTKLLKSILSGVLPSHQYTIASYGACQVGIALASREQLASLPLDAFVLSGIQEHSRLKQLARGGGLIATYDAPPWTGIREVLVAPGGANNPSGIEVTVKHSPEHPEEASELVKHATTTALIAAKNEGLTSVAFDVPMEQMLDEPTAVIAMLTGIHQYFADPSTQPLRNILLRVTDKPSIETANWFIDELTAQYGVWARMINVRLDHDSQADVVAAYLDGKNQIEKTLPTHLPPHIVIAPQPLFLNEETSLIYAPAKIVGPEEGYVRPISNGLLDRAMAKVPVYMRTSGPSIPLPYCYARLRRRHDTSRISGTLLTCEQTIGMQHERSGLQVAVGEIGLTDIPRASVEHSATLFNYIVAPWSPTLTAQLLRFHAGTDIVPEEIFQKVIEGAPYTAAATLDAEELDKLLMANVLHECAEIFWYVLPAEFQERWKAIYPLEKERPGDSFYYRQLLRLHTERNIDFAQESFADKLALFWNDEIPKLFHDQGFVLSREEKEFFNVVMRFAQSRREHYGTAFIMGK